MTSRYELRLLDDGGKRIALLKNYAFFSYARALNNLGTFQIGFPFNEYLKLINNPFFSPDWRIDVWRAPTHDAPLRREQTYLLRKYSIYTRDSDNVQMIILYGHDAKDLLERRYIVQAAGYSETQKTGYIDDMMKEIVREQMLYNNAVDPDGTLDPNRAFPIGEFAVQGDLSLGPLVSQTFADRNVLEVLKELSETSKQLNETNSLIYRKIYFDVVPFETKGLIEYILDEQDASSPILDEMGIGILDELSQVYSTELAWRFETYADLYGQDRTSGIIYSVENGNLESPYLSKTHMEEINTVYVKGFGRGDSRPWDEIADDAAVNLSRWNRREGFQDASSEPDQDNLADYAYSVLYANEAIEELTAVFLNTPGGPDTPQSLYGIDWDLGDILPVQYAGKYFEIEVVIVYVSVNADGQETITGRNDVVAGV